MNEHLHLTVDEVVRCKRDRFRMQIWQAPDHQPVVVFVGIRGYPAPDFYTCRLATIAVRDFLHFQLPLPVFFHYSIFEDKARAFKVESDVIGHPLRPILTEAKYTQVNSETIERVFGLPAHQPKEVQD